jgi:hypothetical protein
MGGNNTQLGTEFFGLLKIATELVGLLDKGADILLPEKVVDVVKLHSKVAAGAAWLPTGFDIAAGGANIWTMYVRINNKLGLQFKKNILKTIGSGVAANLSSYSAMMLASEGIKATGVMYALNITSGWIYLNALLWLAKRHGSDVESGNLGDAVKEVMKDSTVIQDFMNKVSDYFKKTKTA